MYRQISCRRYSNTPTDFISDEANKYLWGGYSGMSNQNTWAIACTCEAIKIGISGALVVVHFAIAKTAAIGLAMQKSLP